MPPPTVPPRKEARQIRETYRQSTASATLRTRDEVARFFDGMELIETGIIGVRDWGTGLREASQTLCYGGVGVTLSAPARRAVRC